ncbi:helix-turn-helix domain-containing protein [Nonomuraea sp. NPDC049486]|uniref:ArsR/SmtB family transcription factor n=1 Tax=unclassified Nonomuraea TaxID=2593643 RepID=UPI0011CECBDC|nr:helix-turn-helix domain-containing protein [Nonomuraea sp. C10]TXK43215.1 helix-turn-helix domain-containing protein [Nonomuraea sp. C10]
MAEHGTRKLDDLEALRALAHPRRQRILNHLSAHGPATSAELARELDLNTGATSYHLRELAKHGFVEELPEKAHGRERWWRFVPADLRFPLRSEQDEETRAIIDEMNARAIADDMQAFRRAQAAVDPGGWGDAFPYSRGTIRVTLEELAEFFEEYIALLGKYDKTAEEAGPGARRVHTRFFAYPESDG